MRIAVLLLLVCACSAPPPPSAPMDSGTTDAGVDAGADGGATDGGADAGCGVITPGSPLDLCLRIRHGLADAMHRCGQVWDPTNFAEQISNPFCYDVAARVASGEFGFDADAGATCVLDLQDAGICDPIPTSVACDNWFTVPIPVHPPPQMVGDPCGLYGNCFDIGWCAADPRSCQVCQPFRTLGQSCSYGRAPYGTYDPSYQGLCDPTLDCRPGDGGTYCVDLRIACGASICKPNVCVPQLDGGAACAPLPLGADCGSGGYCDTGLTCRPDALDAGHCEPQAMLGAHCDHDTLAGECADADASCIEGICQIIAPHSRDDGFECAAGEQCKVGSFCSFSYTCGDSWHPAPCPGSCARFYWRGSGEACGPPPVDSPPPNNFSCMTDLRCGSDWNCHPMPLPTPQCDLPKLGEACDTTCAYGQGSCFQFGPNPHICQPFLDAGEPCFEWYNQDQACASGLCLPDDDGGVLVCAPGCGP